MQNLRFASKSCSCLMLAKPANYSIRTRAWSSGVNRENYLKMKEDFIEKFYTKQRRIQDAADKLVGLRKQRKIVAVPKLHQEATADCEKSAGLIECDIKMNCVRARGFKDDNQIMVAVDKIAEGCIQKNEKSKLKRPWRSSVKSYRSDTTVVAGSIPFFRE